MTVGNDIDWMEEIENFTSLNIEDDLNEAAKEWKKESSNLKENFVVEYNFIEDKLDKLRKIYDNIIEGKELPNNSQSDNIFNHHNIGLMLAKTSSIEKDYKDLANSLHKLWWSFLLHIGQRKVSIFLRGLQYNVKMRIAFSFYRSHEFDFFKSISHMQGIDFESDVEIIIVKKNYPLEQWSAIDPKKNQGNYYGYGGDHNHNESTMNENSKSRPDCLGINPYQKINNDEKEREKRKYKEREKRKYRVFKNTLCLKSIAAGVLDIWSVPEKPYDADGGCAQYFNAKNKINFKHKEE